jgi:dephospho-CoA kinase
MLGLRKVAITGGLSCGKSSVCRILKELGAYVISADEIVHQLLSHNANLREKTVNLLGKDILVDDKIDRSQVANIVFANPELLQALENLLHPAVYQEIEKEYQKQKNTKASSPLFVAEVPLLFESGGQIHFNCTVAVVADPTICYDRFYMATGGDPEDFNNRMARQMSPLEKAVLADYAILNHGTLNDLQETTKELYQELITE